MAVGTGAGLPVVGGGAWVVGATVGDAVGATVGDGVGSAVGQGVGALKGPVWTGVVSGREGAFFVVLGVVGCLRAGVLLGSGVGVAGMAAAVREGGGSIK